MVNATEILACLLLLQKCSAHPAILIQNLIFHWFQFDYRDKIVSHRHTIFLFFYDAFLRDFMIFHGDFWDFSRSKQYCHIRDFQKIWRTKFRILRIFSEICCNFIFLAPMKIFLYWLLYIP